MHSFEVTGQTPEDFVARVNRSLDDHGLSGNVTVRFEGEDIVARIRWMGTTELRYRAETTDEGFRADLDRHRVAPLHGAFQHAFEERLEGVLEMVGARLI